MKYQSDILIIPPLFEPLLLTETKDALRVDGTQDDDRITKLIVVARIMAEDFASRALMLQEREVVFDLFPWLPDLIIIPRAPVLSITSLKYIDTDGIEQTLLANDYSLDKDSEPARMRPAYGKTWPGTRAVFNAVRLRYKAGYSDNANAENQRGAVPEDIKQALYSIVAANFEQRSTTIFPPEARASLANYRLTWF